MSFLARQLSEYLAIRHALGFKLERAGRLLPDFIRHLERRRATTITADLALEWAKQPGDGHREWWADRFALVRSFADYVKAVDPQTEIPARELMPTRSRRATPYIYSRRHVERLMIAARATLKPFRGETYATLIGLLAVSGMRVGEAIALDRADLHWAQGTLVVRHGKFRRSREIPLHETTVTALRRYAALRARQVPADKSSAFFLAWNGSRLIYNNVHKCFHDLVGAVGFERRGPNCRPRIHDLRHTFAVQTLVAWYRADEDVEALLPRLSTYLGHVNPNSTYWYLSASPELLRLAARRTDRARRLP